MNAVLVDTSLWIDYFKGIETTLPLNDSIRKCPS